MDARTANIASNEDSCLNFGVEWHTPTACSVVFQVNTDEAGDQTLEYALTRDEVEYMHGIFTAFLELCPNNVVN